MRRWLHVFFVVLASAAACSKGSTDLVILSSGQIEKGQLKSCAGEDCLLNEKSVPRERIVWIGLSVANASPPSVSNPAMDEIHARSGAVESARLISVTASKVVTEKSSFDRTQVAWIHLAQRPRAQKPGDASRPGNLPAVYQWEGFITKHWQYHAKNGPTRFDVEWEGKFLVRMLEVPTSSSRQTTPADGSISLAYDDNLAPLALDYWIKGRTDEVSAVSGEPDLTISGLAQGHLEGEKLFKQFRMDVPRVDVGDDPNAPDRVFVSLPDGFAGMGARNGRLSGEILRINRAHPPREGEGPGRPRAQHEECGYVDDLPGSYRVWVSLVKTAPGFETEPIAPLFDGIRVTKSGEEQSREILLDYVPLYGVEVCGRIFSADQETVSGSRTWGFDSGAQGKDTWTFHRTRCNDPKGCKSTLSPLDLANLPVPR